MRSGNVKWAQLFGAFVVASLVATANAASDDPGEQRSKGRAILVFDASGSMNDAVRGGAEKRIAAARKAMRALMSRWNASSDVGLIVYGHRESPRDKAKSCDDIEMVVPPGPPDPQRVRSIVDFVDRVQPRGETPLTKAVLQAADMLKADGEPGTVILVTDGEESCGEDPCKAARTLAESGVDLTVHVVGFNVSDPAIQQQLRCLPDATGGWFKDARDGQALESALVSAMESTYYRLEVENTYAFHGLPYEVKWQGANRRDDAITLAPRGAPPEDRSASAPTSAGSPAKLVVPDASGPYEVRYLSGRRNRVVLKLDVTVRGGPATLEAAASVPAGSDLEIAWTGPDYDEDRVAIVKASESDNRYLYPDFSAPTKDGNPARLRAFSEPGDYELRYLAVRGGRVLARRPIRLVSVATHVEAPERVEAGASFDVVFAGPNAREDRIVVVPQGTKDGSYINDAGFTHLASAGSPFHAVAASKPGGYEVRYVSGADGQVLARAPVAITPSNAKVEAPAALQAAIEFDVTFAGPFRSGDRIVLVEAGTKEGAYVMSDKQTRPATGDGRTRLTAPSKPGEYEVRYLAAAGGPSLALAKVRVGPSDASIEAPNRVRAATEFEVRVKGPKSDGDRVLIVPSSEPDARYIVDAAYTQTISGRDSIRLKALDDPGTYEIRYVAGVDGGILARARIEVTTP